VEIYYPGLSHGLTATHSDLVNGDLLAFCSKRKAAYSASREREVASVAAAVGYESEAAFSRVFKKLVGQAPGS